MAGDAEPDAAAAVRPGSGARDPLRAAGGGESLRGGPPDQPDHGADARGVARRRGCRQDVLRPARGPARAGARRRGAAALRHPPAAGRAAVADGGDDRTRVRARPGGALRRRGEARVRGDVHPRRPLQPERPAAHRRQAGRAGPPARARQRRAGRRPHRAAAGLAPGEEAQPRVHHRAGRPAGGAARAPRAADAGAPALLLLGLPAQPLDGGARGLDGRRRHRMSRHGAFDAGAPDVRHHPHGRRGRAVGRDGAVHPDEAHLPESRRRHVLPLGLARGPPGRRGGDQRDVQDPLQLRGGDDGWPGRGGRDAGAGPDAPARGRGRQAHHRHHRRARQVRRGRALGPRHRGLAPRPPRRGAAGAARHRRRDRARPRPALRRREAPSAQARPAREPGAARVHQRVGLRGLRRLRREVELPVRPAGGHGVRAQDADPPVVVQQGLLVPARRLPVVPDRHPERRAESQAAQGLPGRARPARAGAQGAGHGQRLHDGHRRHRGRHRQPDPRHRGAARRQARARPRPDGSQPEGRPRRLAPQDLRARGGGLQQGGRRRGRLLSRLRHPRGDVAAEPRPRER